MYPNAAELRLVLSDIRAMVRRAVCSDEDGLRARIEERVTGALTGDDFDSEYVVIFVGPPEERTSFLLEDVRRDEDGRITGGWMIGHRCGLRVEYDAERVTIYRNNANPLNLSDPPIEVRIPASMAFQRNDPEALLVWARAHIPAPSVDPEEADVLAETPR